MCQVSVEVELAVMRVPWPLCKNALLERMQASALYNAGAHHDGRLPCRAVRSEVKPGTT